MKIDNAFAQKLDELCFQRKAHDFYHSIQPFMHAINGIYNRNIHTTTFEPEEVYLSFKDMERLALAFYKDFDNELYYKLKEVLNDPYTIYETYKPKPQDKNNPNKNSCGIRFGHPHIELTPENNVCGLLAPAHEFSHALSQRIQKFMKQRTDCLGEIESKFIEKVYLDFLLEHDIISQEDYKNCQNITRRDLALNCELLIQENDILSQITPPITKDKLDKFLEDNKNNPNINKLKERLDEMTFGDTENMYGEYIFRYVVGEAVAAALYEDYKKEPAEIKQKFKEFLRTNAEISTEEALQILLGENAMAKINDVFFPQAQNSLQQE